VLATHFRAGQDPGPSGLSADSGLPKRAHRTNGGAIGWSQCVAGRTAEEGSRATDPDHDAAPIAFPVCVA